jgi:acyl carrier protein
MAVESNISTAWPTFADAIVEATGAPPERVTPQALLVQDLKLDSLALVELVVELLERHPESRLSTHLDERDWESTTVGQLFEACAEHPRGNTP